MADGFGRASRREIGSHNANPQAFNGLWDGVVVDDLDPKKIGRVRVRIFDLHDEDTPVDDLPWAFPNFPSAFMASKAVGGNRASGGMFQVPPIDALVNIMFKHGDPEFPVWIGGWFAEQPAILGRETYTANGERKALYNADGRPSCPTWRSLRGHIIELDDEIPQLRITSVNGHKITLSDGSDAHHGDCIKLEDHKGNYIWMDTGRNLLQIRWKGDVEEHIKGNKSVKIEGNLIQEIGGDFALSVAGKTTIFGESPTSIDSPTINLNCGVAVEVPAHVLQQGDASAGDFVHGVLAQLGNAIRKIVTGS
jgi:hypothetical protein